MIATRISSTTTTRPPIAALSRRNRNHAIRPSDRPSMAALPAPSSTASGAASGVISSGADMTPLSRFSDGGSLPSRRLYRENVPSAPRAPVPGGCRSWIVTVLRLQHPQWLHRAATRRRNRSPRPAQIGDGGKQPVHVRGVVVVDEPGAQGAAGVADAERPGHLPRVVVPVPHVDLALGQP